MRPEIVLGSPGCGKTTALLKRLREELASGTRPDRIGFVSFTRKAATEAMDRACAEFGRDRTDFPFFSTLHSLCFRQLGLRRGDILEGARLQKFAQYAGIRVSGKFSEDGLMGGFDLGDRALFMENLARTRCVDLRNLFNENDDKLVWKEVHRVSRCLAVYKAAHGLMDFTDMLSEFVRSKIRLGLEVLFVDESQDLSILQNRVVAVLAEGCRRVVYAGDDDQAIYRWAGADVDTLINMDGDAHVLGRSWRVPPVVQTVAEKIIRRVKNRREKTWAARENSVGEVRRETKFDLVDLDEERRDDTTTPTLILARNTYLLREQVEPELRRRGVIYERHGHPSISDRFFSAVVDWERLRKGVKLPVSRCRELYELMGSGTGVARGSKSLPTFDNEEETLSIEDLRESGGLLRNDPWYDALDRLPTDDVGYLRAALKRGEKPGKRPRVVVSTIHGSKGGEARHVILMKEMAGRTWGEFKQNPEDEARVFYVGATRAKEKLTIVDSSNGRGYPFI